MWMQSTVEVILIFNILQLDCTYCLLPISEFLFLKLFYFLWDMDRTDDPGPLLCLTLQRPMRQTRSAPDSESHREPSITSAGSCLHTGVSQGTIKGFGKVQSTLFFLYSMNTLHNITPHLNVPGRVMSLHIKRQGLSDLEKSMIDICQF